MSICPASLFLNAFTPTHTSTGLGAENDRLLTSAFDNILLSLSTRYQKEEKDGKLSLHGTRCDIRSFFPWLMLSSSSGDPPGSARSSLRDSAQLAVKMQVQGPRSPLGPHPLSSAVSRASPDLSEIVSKQPSHCFPEVPLPAVPSCPRGGPFLSTHIFPSLSLRRVACELLFRGYILSNYLSSF